MFRYLIIESKKTYTLDEDIIHLFDDFLDYQVKKINDHQSILYYDHEVEHSFKEIILNMMSDTYTDLRIYVSYVFTKTSDRDEHATETQAMLESIPFSKYYYVDDKIITKFFLNNLTPQIKKHMLKRYYQDSIMNNTIETYLEANLNMVIAAKKLYLHRNTLIQRLDKFYQVTGFDVRIFNDALLVYHLIQ